MKFNHMVKYKGVYYPTGAEVPVGVPEKTKNEEGQDDKTKIYKKGDFTTVSKVEIAKLAESLGYTVTSDKKAEMIDEFLEQQEQKQG